VDTIHSLFMQISAALLACASAQDPANGWLAYAVGDISSTGAERITRLEMTWKVGATPTRSFAFFSPWFGMDPGDNLNLIQPVNPWSGGEWSMYTEYFQWSPEDNSNSGQRSVEAGQHLHGSLVYDESTDSYELSQEVVETGAKSTQTVKCQDGKKYVIPYVVYEKAFACRDYPPDGIVTFTDIIAECDGQDCAADIKWEAKNEDNHHCGMQAHINGNQNISITWDTDGEMAPSLRDFTHAQLHDFNMHGWATQLNITRPE